MADKSMLFIYNPRAGKAQIRSNLLDIIDIFVKCGYEVTAYPTQGPGDATQAVKNRRKGYDLIVCSGGDGTLDEVVSGMMQCEEKTPIGYVPAGSTNDFARSLGIPRNMKEAAHTAVEGRDFSCDIGAFNGDSFIYVAAFGIFTDVTYETKQEWKNMLGYAAYVLEGARRIPNIKAVKLKVTYGDQVIEEEFILGLVTNSLSVGGFSTLTDKETKLDDGLFEVLLIKKPGNALELNSAIVALVDKHLESNLIYSFKTDHITFESDEEVKWTLDGESGGQQKLVSIQNKKQAIMIRVP